MHIQRLSHIFKQKRMWLKRSSALDKNKKAHGHAIGMV
jgi:hypothetical protein